MARPVHRMLCHPVLTQCAHPMRVRRVRQARSTGLESIEEARQRLRQQDDETLEQVRRIMVGPWCGRMH